MSERLTPSFIDAASLRHATGFMADARRIQRESGRKPGGQHFLSAELLTRSRRIFSESRLLAVLAEAPSPVPEHVLRHICDSFEEMCRRRRIEVQDSLRPSIYRLLAIELAINTHLFEASPEKVAPATVYNGSLDCLWEMFPQFCEMPYLFRQAATAYPSDPAGYLKKLHESISELERDERFVEFRDTPSVFRNAAIGYPSDPAEFLKSVQRSIRELNSNEKFAQFRDTPSLFRAAAVHYPSDPARYLEQVQNTIRELESDDELAEFRDTPWVFRDAALNHSDPAAFLLNAKKVIAQLKADDRFIELHGRAHTLREAAIQHGADPAAYLLSLLNTGNKPPAPHSSRLSSPKDSSATPTR